MFFVKMQGLGNDYIYVSAPEVPEDAPGMSRRLSDRHFGIGSDGMIWICPSDAADFSMRIFNADGSEAMMCGNGIRCVGKYIHDYGLSDKTALDIETRSGLRHLELHLSADKAKVDRVTVEMGTAKIQEKRQYIMPDGTRLCGMPVNVGNPHLVFFAEEGTFGKRSETDDSRADFVLTDAQLIEWGSFFQHHPDFPGGVNVEFCRKTGPSALRMRVYERGSAITMACGTGACAAAYAAWAQGLAEDSCVSVWLDGGELEITLQGKDQICMTGPAVTVFEGTV